MDLRERALDGALGARQPEAPRRDRAERDDDRLLVREHERRDPEARADPVAAPHAALALDRDAELLQPRDVAPDRAASMSSRSAISRPVVTGCVCRSSRRSSRRAVGGGHDGVKQR